MTRSELRTKIKNHFLDPRYVEGKIKVWDRRVWGDKKGWTISYAGCPVTTHVFNSFEDCKKFIIDSIEDKEQKEALERVFVHTTMEFEFYVPKN